MKIERFYSNGTTIEKIENPLDYSDCLNMNDNYFMNDYIYVSLDFVNAVSRGLIPTTEQTQEWHHYFISNGSSWTAKKVNFK